MQSIEIRNPHQILSTAIARACGLVEYRDTIEQLRTVNVFEDTNYRKNFVSYYRVRRDQAWLDAYFAFMEANKNNTSLTFAEILRHISAIPHNTKSGKMCTVEASFASKMLATIDPNNPVWDGQVVKALGIQIPDAKEEKLPFYITAYAELKQQVEQFLLTAQAQQCIDEFDALFPDFSDISPIKKIDFFLWQLGI